MNNEETKPVNKKVNDLYASIYAIVKQIPKGRVTSYGAIANALGIKSSARLVGYAMNAIHVYDASLPAHRVVNRNGLLTGKHHFNTISTMQQLLEKDGMVIENDKVLNFNTVFWDP